jgi:hypothetical protein
MWRIFTGISLCIFFIVGCQPNNTDEVGKEQKDSENDIVNKQGIIKNLEGLEAFIEKVNNHEESEINYVQYGEEGQRGVMTLTSNTESINVSHNVDGQFIEEYNCENLIIVTEEEVDKYILNQCTGDFVGDFELFSIAEEDK